MAARIPTRDQLLRRFAKQVCDDPRASLRQRLAAMRMLSKSQAPQDTSDNKPAKPKSELDRLLDSVKKNGKRV